MNISNPSLTLRFIAESATETISSDYIGIHSITFKEQLIKELKSSSNSVTLQIADDCPYIENILKASGDVSAVFKDGNTALFTGYLSDNHKWVITDRGTQALSITLEDVGTKLLGKTFLTNSVSSEHVFDDYINASSSHSIVKEVCDAAGITMAENTPVITVKAVKSIDRDTTCKQILDDMLYEAGYAYYFTNEGKLNLYEINCVSTSGIPQLNSNSLYVVDGNAITLTKKVKQYKQANINWTSLEYRNNVRVYEDISGQSTTYPHCNISIPIGKSYPDEYGNIAKTEAADLDKGNEIIYISDVTPDISVVAGQYTSNIAQIGSKAIGVLITNTGVETVEVRKLQATADICCVKAKNVTVAGETVDVDESKNLYKYDAEYIHDGDSAKRLANLIVNYHKYCNYTYTFYSKVSYASGTLVNLIDDMYSGLDTNVLIIGRSYNDSTDIIQYTAIAISAFDLTKTVFTDSTTTAPSVIPGPPGPPGEPGDPGEPSKVFSIVCPILNFNSDKRVTGNFTVNLSSNIQGYDSVIPTWATTAGTVSPSTGLNTTLTFPKNTASDVTITMTATGITPAVFVIHPIDITDYNKNWGTLTALPSGVILDGDYFIAGSNFDSYVLGKPYVRISDRWDNLIANSVENTARLFSLLGNVMESDLTVPSTSAMYAWFGTLVAQDAAIQKLFSKNITILSNGSIHSDTYDDDGSYIGPGPGFYLGADGELKCNSANTSDLNAVNANISGNSSFHGSFDCTIIKTTPESPTTYVTLTDGLIADSVQAVRIVDQMIAYGLISGYVGPQTTSPMFPIQVVGVPGISYMQVKYQGSNSKYSASVYFYDSSRNQVNIRNYVTCSKNAGNWSNQLWSTNDNSSSVYYGQWASNGIEIRVLTGLNRLWVDVPNAASASTLSSGMLFKATTATTVGGVSCYPLYVKA